MTAAGRPTIVAADGGEQFQIGQDRFVRKLAVGGSRSGFALVDYTGAPGVPGPPPHLHRSFTETFYLLHGELEFVTGAEHTRVRAGETVHVPVRVAHSFRVMGPKPARWLGIFSPGRFVHLIEELGPLIPLGGPPDREKVARLFAKYDTELV